jgi:hypothetical protein
MWRRKFGLRGLTQQINAEERANGVRAVPFVRAT